MNSERRELGMMIRSCVLAALLLSAPTGLISNSAAQMAPAFPPGESSREPLHFRKTVFFDTQYLAQVVEAANRRRREAAELRAAEAASRAATFAERYGISRELAQQILDVAIDERVDPDLAFRLVRTESRFHPRARGPRGALGLLQLMPSTARALDRSLRTEAQILEPSTNLRLGFRYLRQMIERYDGDVRLGLLAYNRGEGAVDRALRRGNDPENGYSHRVLGSRTKDPYRGPGLLPPEEQR